MPNAVLRIGVKEGSSRVGLRGLTRRQTIGHSKGGSGGLATSVVWELFT